MRISDFLSVADVTIDVRAADKSQLLLEMSSKAAQILGLPADEIYAEIEKREQLGSTGMGAGVAIPHARLSGLNRALAMVVRLKPPIDFDAIDAEPVDLVAMLLLPAPQSSEGLAMLAQIARKLKTRDDIIKMRRAPTAAALFNLLAAI